MLDPDLQYLIHIANFRSMARAADELAVSQSTLSRAVQRLESRFGVSLVDRTSRGVCLTDPGTRLVARLMDADRQLRDAENEMNDIAMGRKGLVRIAAGHTVSSPVVRALVPRLRIDRPAANLQLDTCFNKRILQRLADGDYDFGVSLIPADLPSELVAYPLLRDRLVPVVRQGHPITSIASPVVDDLMQFLWVGAARHILSNAALDALFVRANVARPDYAVQCSSYEAAIDAVKSSDCITFAPDWQVRQGIGLGAGLAMIEVPGFAHPRTLGILERRGAYISPLGRRAQELVTEALELLNARAANPSARTAGSTSRSASENCA